MNEQVLISILSVNRRDGARECLEAVLKHAPGCRIVLTDNASKDGTAEMFDEYAKTHKNIEVFHEKENTGFKYGHDRAFRMAATGGNRFFFCLNDDVVINAGTMDALLTEFASDPYLAVCGDSKGCCEIDEQFHGKGGRLEYVEASSMIVNVPLVAGLRPNLFSEDLKFAYGEDSDLSLFLRERGLNIRTVDAGVVHKRGQTSRNDPEIRRKCESVQDHNHTVNLTRWAHYIKVRRMDYPIVIKRDGALGDVILTTPIIRAIKEGCPKAIIKVETGFPGVFDNSPRVQIAENRIKIGPDDLVIDLNLAYENRPMTHIVDAYEEIARKACPGMEKVEKRTELFLSDPKFEEMMLPTLRGKKVAAIHTDRSHWPGKNIPLPAMIGTVEWLRKNGWVTIAIGSFCDERMSRIGCDTALNGTMTFPIIAQMLKFAQLFVGPDSAPFHFAQAVGCPTVVAYGCTRARYIATIGSPHAAVESDESIPGSGERHRSTGQVSSSAGTECMDSITSEAIIAGIKKLI